MGGDKRWNPWVRRQRPRDDFWRRGEIAAILDADYVKVPKDAKELAGMPQVTVEAIPGQIRRLRGEMKEAAAKLDFERAAELRDRIRKLEEMALQMGEIGG